MTDKIEPIYLRYIYDGLNNESIHPQNASALPDGFVSMYEEAFDDSLPFSVRQKLIKIFELWALLKKEVSFSFVANILEIEEKEIKEVVLTYSKWFNCPEPGKYIIFHERLRMYIIERVNNNIIIELLNSICNQLNNESEYLDLYKLDHQIVLSYFENEKYDLIKNTILEIEYNQTDSKDLYSAKKRWFKNASILSGYFKDYTFIKTLHLKYNEFISPQISLEDDWQIFESNGVDFLLDKAESFFSNKSAAYLYLCYFLHLVLQEDILNINNKKSVSLLVNRLNQIQANLNSEEDYLLNKRYFFYLNDILLKNGFPILESDKGLDGFPSQMTEDGFSGNFDYGFNENNKVIYFGDEDRKISKIKNLLISSFRMIGGIPNSLETATKVIDRILMLQIEGDIKSIESFLNIVRKKVLNSESKFWDDLLNYDSFVFEVFKLVSINESKYNFNSWRHLFICSPKMWQQNISFWLMLVDINFEGDIDELYRIYRYGSNEMAFEDKYIIDEFSFVSFVLSLNDRNFEMPSLIKKMLPIILNKNYYNHAIDTLSSSYLLGSINEKKIDLINSFFYKNDLLSSNIYIHQICYLLSEKIGFLDLIDFVYYDYHLQSDVTENYIWSWEIINAIKNKKNTGELLNYLLGGFEIYIKIMGKYSLDEINNPEDCPKENKWKIEWWVMCNIYACIIEVFKDEKDSLDYFIKTIENIYLNNGFDSSINLKIGLERYSTYRKIRNRKQENNYEYTLHQNTQNQLFLFKDNMYNKQIISKIAGSIKSGNLNIKN